MLVPIRAIGAVSLVVIGAIIGRLAAKEEMQTTVDTTPKKQPDLTVRIRQSGLDIVTADGMPDDNMSLSDYMTHLYRGLYMIGRTHAVLKGDTQESIAHKLLHLHHQCRPTKDKKLIDWYTTVGQASTHDLSDLLGKCPEAKRFDVRYIAHAMGEDVKDLSFPTLDEEVVGWFAT